VFGFSTAFLPGYVQEKTAGRIAAGSVERFGLADVRGDTGERLRGYRDNACCVVDAEQQSDLDGFARQALDAAPYSAVGSLKPPISTRRRQAGGWFSFVTSLYLTPAGHPAAVHVGNPEICRCTPVWQIPMGWSACAAA